MNKRILLFLFVLIALSTKGQDTFENYYGAAGTATLKLNCKHPLKQVQVKAEPPKLDQDEEEQIFGSADHRDAARA
jgi:hypothetical protein